MTRDRERFGTAKQTDRDKTSAGEPGAGLFGDPYRDFGDALVAKRRALVRELRDAERAAARRDQILERLAAIDETFSRGPAPPSGVSRGVGALLALAGALCGGMIAAAVMFVITSAETRPRSEEVELRELEPRSWAIFEDEGTRIDIDGDPRSDAFLVHIERDGRKEVHAVRIEDGKL